ncbi:MAG: Glyoxalase/bleomycin resistance protein/dioxygenase [Alphaproteobacteria bacterium]|nr:Glyoxalase/bleomycin resistance protein/dioxygenase [Alphaproteobacteria bacterium]
MAVEMTGLTPLLEVFDMPAAIQFYRDILGFEIVASSPEVEGPEGRYFHWAWLRGGGAELMLNTAYDTGERPPERDPARWARHAHTTLYIGCPDPDAAYRYLRSRGIEVDPPAIAPYGMKQLSLRDPEGYGLCFQAQA